MFDATDDGRCGAVELCDAGAEEGGGERPPLSTSD